MLLRTKQNSLKVYSATLTTSRAPCNFPPKQPHGRTGRLAWAEQQGSGGFQKWRLVAEAGNQAGLFGWVGGRRKGPGAQHLTGQERCEEDKAGPCPRYVGPQ